MKKGAPAWLWIVNCGVTALFLGWFDQLTGSELNFFVFYFLPVALAAWYVGLGAAVGLAVLCALVWFGADVLGGHLHSSHAYAVWNTMIRLVSFLAIGWSVARTRTLLERERETAAALSRSLSEIKVLEAIIPICAQCKKIRDENGRWQTLEAYFCERGQTRFSHGYCPECARRAYAEAGLPLPPEEPAEKRPA